MTGKVVHSPHEWTNEKQTRKETLKESGEKVWNYRIDYCDVMRERETERTKEGWFFVVRIMVWWVLVLLFVQ